MTMTDTDAEVRPGAALSTMLRDGSRAEHEDAEGSSFMSELLAGRVGAHGYADYLARLRRVYAAIESVGHGLAGDPVAAAVLDPALERLASIDADLAFWGPGRADTPATDAYVERVRASAVDPRRFVAHHYTRYLGDLSGGRAIGRILASTFELVGPGVAFYDFPGVPKPKPYKDAYRARLDALPLAEAEKVDVLAEVKIVFALNQALFDELTADLETYRR